MGNLGSTDQGDPTFFDLNRRIDRGNIILNPDFQRNYVWDNKKESQLIESILLKLPLPMIYFAETADGKKVVIDGQQRLTAISRFMHNEYVLKKLNVFKDFNGKSFDQLPPEAQDVITEGTIRCVTFKNTCDPELKFQVFMRLNSGSVPLKEMELRNCLYRGKYMELLKELAQYPDFLKAVNVKKEDLTKRMMDLELVLRFCSLYHNGHNYQSPAKTFMNRDAAHYQSISDEDADELRKAFKNAIGSIYSIFGDKTFRKYENGNGDNHNGKWYTKFNVAVYEAMMYAFRRTDKNAVMHAKDDLREAIISLMVNDLQYAKAIDKATGNQSSVLYRINTTEQVVRDILSAHPLQPRCFSREIKEQLFAQNQTCAICGNKIETIDDAHVDHIEQYHEGGETTIENARLTHRFCNQSRPRHEATQLI